MKETSKLTLILTDGRRLTGKLGNIRSLMFRMIGSHLAHKSLKHHDDSYWTLKTIKYENKVQKNENLPLTYEEIKTFRHHLHLYDADKILNTHSAIAIYQGDRQLKWRDKKTPPQCLCSDRHYFSQCPSISEAACSKSGLLIRSYMPQLRRK